jgi:hypothetical protein
MKNIIAGIIMSLLLAGSAQAIIGDIEIDWGEEGSIGIYSPAISKYLGKEVTRNYWDYEGGESYQNDEYFHFIFSNSDLDYSRANDADYYNRFNREQLDGFLISNLPDHRYHGHYRRTRTGVFNYDSDTKIFMVLKPRTGWNPIQNCIVDASSDGPDTWDNLVINRRADTATYIDMGDDCLGFEYNYVIFKLGTVGDYVTIPGG